MGERGGVWRKLARGYPALTGYTQTGQGQDRTVVGGETRKWKSGRVGAWGPRRAGGAAGPSFPPLSEGGGGAGLAGFRCSLGPLSVSACLQHGEDVSTSPPAHARDLCR